MGQIYQKSISGFSLLAMVMMIVVLSLLMMVGITLYKSYDEQKRLQVTSKNMALVEEALKNYVTTYGYLPCPAPLTAAPDTAEFGKPVSPVCAAGSFAGTDYDAARNVRIGAVPVRALNLSDTAMLDGYKNRFFYAVTSSFAFPGANMNSPDGKITVNDQNGNSVSSNPGKVIYALVSPGSDRRGAYNISGGLIQNCDPASANFENCNGDGVFVSRLEKTYADSAQSFTSSLTYMANTMTYMWVTDPWGSCQAACMSNGTQTRNVYCRQVNGGTVADSFCLSLGAKPTGSQSCTNSTPCNPGNPPSGQCDRFIRHDPGPQGGSYSYVFGAAVTTCPSGSTCVNAMTVDGSTPVLVAIMPGYPVYNQSGDACSESPNGSNGGNGG